MPFPQNVPSLFTQEELFMFFHRIATAHDLPVLTGRPQLDWRHSIRVRQDSPLSCEKLPGFSLMPLSRTAFTGKAAPESQLFLNGRPDLPSWRALRRAVPQLAKNAGHLRLRHHFFRHHEYPVVKRAILPQTRPADTPSGHQHTTAI